MASKASKSRAQKYSLLTDVQKNILKQYFEEGMVGTGRQHQQQIVQAAEEADLSKNQVEKWIGNERKRRQQTVETTEHEQPKKIKLPSMQRGPNPYNLFCAEFFRTGECKGLNMTDKNRLASSRWEALPKEEKKKYEEISRASKVPNVTQLSQEERKQLIDRHRRQLLAEIMFLEDLGCNSALLFVDPCGEMFTLGSVEGTAFLSLNQDVLTKFRQHFYTQSKRYTYRHVQELFNKKYSQAIGKPGSRVPYLKKNFVAQGLPDGIVFKKPFCYGAQQCRAIMEAADTIVFIVNQTSREGPQDSGQPCTSASNPESTQSDDPILISILKKVASDANVEEVISGKKILKEEEINVEDCVLDQEERLTLYKKCRMFFDQDAWSAVGHNSRDCSQSPKDLVFPLYTAAEDEDFWLFYFPGEVLSNIFKARDSKKLKGYWLDRTENDKTYKMLPEQDEIKVKWIIKTDHGPLYYEKSLNGSANGVQLKLTDLFIDCIRNTLQEYGFLRT